MDTVLEYARRKTGKTSRELTRRITDHAGFSVSESTLCGLVQQAVEATGTAEVPVAHKPTLLSDNGSGYISRAFNEYLELMQIRHIFTARLHPQTIGKFGRLNRTAKDRLGLVIYTSPEELERAVARFQRWYNHERYHESIGNLRAVDVYEGRAEDILCDCEAVAGRKELKRQTLRARPEHNLGVSDQQERAGQTGSQVHPISSPAVSERI